jgi:hypothetical protein
MSLLTKGRKSLKLKIENKNIDINLLDKKLMKDLMKVSSGKKTFWGKLGSLKSIADNLKNEGLTVTVSYEGTIVLKLGSEASSSLLGDAIEIRDLSKLLRLVLI